MFEEIGQMLIFIFLAAVHLQALSRPDAGEHGKPGALAG